MSFLGWELCELAGAVEMEASVADNREYVASLKSILDQKILPVKRAWMKPLRYT